MAINSSRQPSAEIDRRFSEIEARITSPDGSPESQLPSKIPDLVLALAEKALGEGLMSVYQTTRSIASFLEGMQECDANEQDRLQLNLLLDNLRHELYPLRTYP